MLQYCLLSSLHLSISLIILSFSPFPSHIPLPSSLLYSSSSLFYILLHFICPFSPTPHWLLLSYSSLVPSLLPPSSPIYPLLLSPPPPLPSPSPPPPPVTQRIIIHMNKVIEDKEKYISISEGKQDLLFHQEFVVVHYAGTVKYNIEGFMDKNKVCTKTM